MAILTSQHDLLIAMAIVNALEKLYKTNEEELHNQTVLNGPQLHYLLVDPGSYYADI